MIPAGVLLVAFGGLIAVAPYASSRLTASAELALMRGLWAIMIGLLLIAVLSWSAS